ncbi:MAG: hypothetical protein ACP5H2_11030 [Solirubrobacteraceae bacterium]
MSDTPGHNQSTRRIVLPNGQQIEIVSLGGDAPRHLHICPACDSELVAPVAWSELDDGSWDLTLRCPNCGLEQTGLFSRLEVELLEERLDEGLRAMLADLRRLAHVNMSADVDRFVSALHADMILPEDF